MRRQVTGLPALHHDTIYSSLNNSSFRTLPVAVIGSASTMRISGTL